MSIRIANIRLELGEPEEGLPSKIADRLGLGPDAIAGCRILRKSLDARRHDDLHFTYSAEVRLEEGATPRIEPGSSPDVQIYRPERFDWPAQGRDRSGIVR